MACTCGQVPEGSTVDAVIRLALSAARAHPAVGPALALREHAGAYELR